MTGDADLGDFCDGLTEDIITGLSRIKAIHVTARNTTFTYKNRAVNVSAIGAELGVRYVLEGSVRKSGPRTRVTAQLIETANGHHIWADRFDCTHDDMFDVQDDVTRSIVASVQTQLILHEGRSPLSGATQDQGVTQLLKRSWRQFLQLREDTLAESLALARQALKHGDDSAMAHHMVAVSIYHQMYLGSIPWTAAAIDEVSRHASAAIQAEDADEYCHWAMGCAYLLRLEHELALASHRRALEINPYCSLALGSMGSVLAWAGEIKMSIQKNELALRINPHDPTNYFRHFGLTLANYLEGSYQPAMTHARAILQVRPSWWLSQMVCMATLAQLGRSVEAQRMLAELLRTRPSLNAAALSLLPFANASDREHVAKGLQIAGMPAQLPA